MTGPDGPGPMDWWDDLLADMEAQAADYERDGWEAIELHTGDVTVLDGEFGDRVGLSALVPDDEFDELEAALEAGDVEQYQVFRTTASGYVALLLALETTDGTAILCPLYYPLDEDGPKNLFSHAREAGTLDLFVRRLDETTVTVSLDDPALLAPSNGDE